MTVDSFRTVSVKSVASYQSFRSESIGKSVDS